ncbi:MAG: CBS domain-containing protein, partial [Haloarculaceae archaeon]
MHVRDIMSGPTTIPPTASVTDAIKQMLSHDVDYVVAVDTDGSPGGVLTKTHLLHVVYQADSPPGEIRALSVTRSPRLTLSPEMTAPKAAHRLIKEGALAAPVVEELDVVGVAELFDILDHPEIAIWSVGDRDDDREEWTG